MSCDICGRGNCVVMFHSHEEQERYAEAIEAFELAREIRQRIQDEAESEDDESEDAASTEGEAT